MTGSVDEVSKRMTVAKKKDRLMRRSNVEVCGSKLHLEIDMIDRCNISSKF